MLARLMLVQSDLCCLSRRRRRRCAMNLHQKMFEVYLTKTHQTQHLDLPQVFVVRNMLCVIQLSLDQSQVQKLL